MNPTTPARHEPRAGSRPGSRTGSRPEPDAESRTGPDAESRTGPDAESRTGPDAESRTGPPALRLRPATSQRWDELADFFGVAGAYSGCWCMWWRVTSGEFSEGCRDGAAGNKAGLQRLVADGRVPGLLAYDDGRPVGWVSLGPRPDFGRILRSPLLRPEPGSAHPDDDPADPDVWSVVCFWVPRAQRGRGVGRALLGAAVAHAAAAGARTLEAYPVDVDSRATPDSIFTGTLSLFTKAGFTEVRRRKPTRPVVRLAMTR